MKKALSLVLALVMVLSMGVIGFAADYKTSLYDVTVSDIYKTEAGAYVIDVDINNIDAGVTDITVTAKDNNGNAYAEDAGITVVNANEHKYQIAVVYTTSIANIDAVYVNIVTAGVVSENTYKAVYVAPEAVQQEVIDAMAAAYAAHSTTIKLNAADLDDETLYVADWKYITNTYKDLWNDTAAYLGMDVEVTLDNTIYTIPMADVIWYKNDVDFSIYSNVVDEEGYNAIRTLTGDTKNPLVFGFDGMACPDLTVDMVIPQQWINYYGHKDLTLFAWQEPITAIIQNGADKDKEITVEDAKVLTKTSLDVNTTVTQRIQFKTDYLYEVLVLTANGVASTDNGGSTDDNKDANPNTGANDIVNIAVVFAVVSLAAAGAFVCKKSK